ncbi:flagellar type III secretion system protein FlhB [Hydrogenophaga sp.]|uniref:EscU/YscU/HrcU family type III secretion system export apparatus switch protein n=1 Tax=Hydrogenophaga sp. TaxID=1904254 RepID=UPI0019BA0241|nr:flagellar type III secretion system protein FlhB [Hydrogenophaga sp.]MBD3893118.1 flagellar biosynthesis protein FlhB [Hydrogenophaga sp.]
MEDSSQDKNLPATEQRLKKARDDGQVAHSKDLSNLAVLGGGSLLLLALLPLGYHLMHDMLRRQFHFDHHALLQPELAPQRLVDATLQGLLLVLPLGLALLLLEVLTLVASGSSALSSKPITPDISRISPLAGFGRLFSMQQMAETFKLLVLSLIIGVIAWQFLARHLHAFGTLLLHPLEAALGQLGDWILTGVGLLVAVLLLFAVIDLPLQKFLHGRRLRMSIDEVRREFKEAEGDPLINAQRRARQRQLAQRNSVAAVPKADLVIMNPTHYAVAIRYDDASMAAPRVVAKGADLIALAIRDLARASEVPVLQAPMLARALYAHAEINQEIPSALYTAVAQVLAYVYQVQAALKGQGVMPAQAPTPQVPPELDPHFKAQPKESAP